MILIGFLLMLRRETLVLVLGLEQLMVKFNLLFRLITWIWLAATYQINELPEAMTIQNNDWFLVNRGDHKSIKLNTKKLNKTSRMLLLVFEDAPVDGSQYGRQDGEWTEIVHTPEYTDADVDARLKTNLANGGQILSWNGSDYQWVVDQTGGGGSGGSS